MNPLRVERESGFGEVRQSRKKTATSIDRHATIGEIAIWGPQYHGEKRTSANVAFQMLGTLEASPTMRT